MDELVEVKSDWQRIRQTLAFKLVVLGLIALLLQIPLQLVKNLIEERQKLQKQVAAELGAKWGQPQTVCGPVLLVMVPDGARITVLPEQLKIEGKLRPELRYRGIYQAVLYQADLRLSGSFVLPPGITTGKGVCTVELSDLRGVISAEGTLNGNHGLFGAAPAGVGLGRIAMQVPLEGAVVNFDIALTFNGSQSLLLEPIGRGNDFALSADWNSPGFAGDMLPVSRTITEKGFSAVWKVSDLNTRYPRSWRGNDFELRKLEVGVDMVIPVGAYQQTFRALHYGLLFVGLFLVALLAAERFTRTPTCLVQYLVAACTPVVFYLLLLSVSEQIGFGVGYLLSAAATVLLVTGYCAMIFRKRNTVLVMFVMLSLAYGVMYVILNAENVALLIGSIALFVMLAVVMAITGNVNRSVPPNSNSK